MGFILDWANSDTVQRSDEAVGVCNWLAILYYVVAPVLSYHPRRCCTYFTTADVERHAKGSIVCLLKINAGGQVHSCAFFAVRHPRCSGFRRHSFKLVDSATTPLFFACDINNNRRGP
jgi:hypothetical protein